MKVYYNENDPFAAAWLRRLVAVKAIPEGEIDTRSIVEVSHRELRYFDQCHFFAGIGGWAFALELAGWNQPCWTGSCPCQPFSVAGKREGIADERHLWPHFYRLIEKRRPSTVFGEQVESPDGRLWLSGIRDDMESLDYAFGAADLCAAGVGAPNRRQRLFWLGNADKPGSQRWGERPGERSDQRTPWETGEFIDCTDGKARRVEPGIQPLAYGIPARVGRLRGYGNAINPYVAAEFIASFMDISR